MRMALPDQNSRIRGADGARAGGHWKAASRRNKRCGSVRHWRSTHDGKGSPPLLLCTCNWARKTGYTRHSRVTRCGYGRACVAHTVERGFESAKVSAVYHSSDYDRAAPYIGGPVPVTRDPVGMW